MKRILLAGVTAVALAASGQAFAQTATVEIAPEQRTKIKEYVVKEKVRPVTISERISVGATLPADCPTPNRAHGLGSFSQQVPLCVPR